tara:strand:- start:1066 stop:2904 length:1839 start_codon:yes stop_codon:yes gene_type:complete
MAGKDSSTAIIVIVIMMVTILAIGSGWYLLSGDDDEKDKKKGSACAGPDVNANYEYDSDENCARVSCKTGFWDDGEGFCRQRRDFSAEEEQGTDCVIDGYTYQECNLKINGICGEVGNGTQLRIPNQTEGAVGNGACEAAVNVDCDVACPDECKIPDSQYSIETIACKKDGQILSADSLYCGSGTQAKILDPMNIDLSGTGYSVLSEYLEYANPNNVCDGDVISSICEVECGDNQIDISCGVVNVEEAYIQDTYGNAICFNAEEAADYISGDLAQKPAILETILAADAETRDVNGVLTGYDIDTVADSLRYGKHIKYRSDQGISYATMMENDCTLYSTENCEAPRESQACVLGYTSPKNDDGSYDVACDFPNCTIQGQKMLDWGITTHPFGSTGGQANECAEHETRKLDNNSGCPNAKPCCDKGDPYHYTADACSTDGIQTFTQITSNCSILNSAYAEDTYTEDCCYVGDWSDPECVQYNGVGHYKYTRDVPNSTPCRNGELGIEYASGDPKTKYERKLACDIVQRVAHAYQNFTPPKWMINASPDSHEQYLGVTILANYLYNASNTPIPVPTSSTSGTQHYNVYQVDAHIAYTSDLGSVTYGRWIIDGALD